MWIRVTARAVQKAGNAPEEMEDACFPAAGRETEAVHFRAAVADGATESSYSREWARELARTYCRGRLDGDGSLGGLTRSQRRWAGVTKGEALPWYAQEKLRQGAFSTLLGITVFSEPRSDVRGMDDDGTWTALAAGDSCLFHLRGGRMVCSFPIEEPAGFSNHPRLLCSLPAGNEEAPELVTRTEGRWRHGDIFVLATDALAHWLLSDGRTRRRLVRSRAGRNGRPSSFFSHLDELLANMGCEERFGTWINGLRDSGSMRNDDVTALAMTVRGDPS